MYRYSFYSDSREVFIEAYKSNYRSVFNPDDIIQFVCCQKAIFTAKHKNPPEKGNRDFKTGTLA